MKVRVPNPYYFKEGLIEYHQKDNNIYYTVFLWDKSGMNQFSIETGLNKTPEQILQGLPMILKGMGN